MNRSVCLRALALAPVAGLSLAGAMARAEEPAPSPAAGAPAQPATGTAQTPPPRQTPAQQRYGLPKNPIIGPVENIDLTTPLTLDRAIRIGLQRQNSIAIAQTQIDSAGAQLTRSRASYFPQINPSYSYQYNLQPGGTFIIGGTVLRGSRVTETTNSGLRAQFSIYDSGLREANVGQSRRGVFAAEYGLANERQNVILSVTEGFYNLLRTRELVKVQQESVRRAETALEIIRSQVEVGNAARSDTFQADADLANARVALLQAENDFNVSQASLKNAMGVVSFEPLNLAEANIPAPSMKGDVLGLEDYVKLAYNTRMDIKQQQERVYASGYALRTAQINNGVQINANISQGYNLDPTAGEIRVFTVSASYPLFDGGSSRATVRQNRALLEQDRRTLDQLQQNARLNVEQSYLVREQSRQRIVAADAARQAGRVNYEAAVERQRNGIINILDVINAQVQLVNAEVSYVQAIYDYYIAEARLRRNIGLNDPLYTPRVPGVRPASATAQPTPPQAMAPTAPSVLAEGKAAGNSSASDASGRKP